MKQSSRTRQSGWGPLGKMSKVWEEEQCARISLCVLCRVFFNIDLKIALLPDFLLNLIIGKFCWVILTLVRKYAHPNKMIGSEYE